jgi:Protein of unknown function (DUF2853)
MSDWEKTMAKASDYIADVQRYDTGASEDTVGKIVKHLGIALSRKDSSLVSASDKSELERVRDSWGVKKLGLESDAAMALTSQVAGEMKADREKQRVTFYYLVAKHAGKLESL